MAGSGRTEPAGSSQEPAPSLRGWLRAAAFHYGRVLGNGYRARREVAAALAATATERVLDVGCGTGWFCLAVPGEYVGIDLDRDYLAFAQRRWRSSQRRFELTALERLDAGRGFERAMLINCLHHLSDGEASAVLGRLAQIVRLRLVVVDMDPEGSNWLQRALLRMDRGHFIRSLSQQRALLARSFAIVAERCFRNTPRTAVQVLFVCEPRP